MTWNFIGIICFLLFRFNAPSFSFLLLPPKKRAFTWASDKVWSKVINLVPTIVSFFHYNETYRIYVSVYRIRTVLNFKNKKIKVQKVQILFKFAHTTVFDWKYRYRPIFASINWYLPGTISDINMYLFLPAQYDIYNYGLKPPTRS